MSAELTDRAPDPARTSDIAQAKADLAEHGYCLLDGALKGGSPIHVVIRHTAIWEKRGNDWLIVHEHVSVPSSLPAPSPSKP